MSSSEKKLDQNLPSTVIKQIKMRRMSKKTDFRREHYYLLARSTSNEGAHPRVNCSCLKLLALVFS